MAYLAVKKKTLQNNRKQLKTTSSTNNSSPKPIMQNDERTMVKNSLLLQRSSQNDFPLLRMPRELRDKIYQHSIAAGNLEILRTSKLVNEEASELLSKHAVFRVILGFVDRVNWADLGSVPLSSVQHVELRLSTGPGALPFNLDVVSGFAGNQITRESCIVILNYGKEGSAPYNIKRHRLYLQLARLNGFKSLIIKIVIERYDAAEFEGLFTEEQLREIFPYESRLLTHHEKSYERVRKFLECSLGPGKFDNSVEGHHLEFHPLEPFPEDWNPVFEDSD